MTTPSDTLATARHPVLEVWSVAWPTVLTMTSYTVMQFADKLMVGQVGPVEVAAQGNGGIWSFTPIAFAMGIVTVVNTYVSQNLGAGRPEEGPRYAWAAFWLSVAIWLLVLLPWAALLPFVFDLVHASRLAQLEVIAADGGGGAAAAIAEQEELGRLAVLETGYGQILLLGGLIMLVGRSIHHYFFGLHRPKLITVSAIVGNTVNIVANYVLIFGEQGLPALGLPGVPGVPALGVYGAAIGTILGTALEVAIPAAVFLGPRMHAELGSRHHWRPQWGPIRDLLRIGWPASVQFGNEIVCWAIFMSALVGIFGTKHQAAGWIALSYMHLSFMPAVGFSVAVTSLVGKYIGAGRPDVAVSRARLGMGLAMVYMTTCAIIFYVFRTELITVFVADDVPPAEAAEIIAIGARLMICAAVFQTVDAFGIVYTGALRGAGDTVWPGFVTIIYSWAIIVAGGWTMTVIWPEMESLGPWIAAAVYVILIGITMAARFESGRWRNINLLGPLAEDAARVAPLSPGPPATDPDASVRDIAASLKEAEHGRRQAEEEASPSDAV